MAAKSQCTPLSRLTSLVDIRSTLAWAQSSSPVGAGLVSCSQVHVAEASNFGSKLSPCRRLLWQRADKQTELLGIHVQQLALHAVTSVGFGRRLFHQ